MRAIFIICLLCSFLIADAQPVKTHGQLKVTGTKLKDTKGNDVFYRRVHYISRK